MATEPAPVDPSLLLTDEQLRALIAGAKWTFAKSMPETPHEYVVRLKTMGNEDFVRFATTIRHRGYPHRFGGRIYTYLDVDAHSYWTMGAPMRVTTVLNRALKVNPDTTAA